MGNHFLTQIKIKNCRKISIFISELKIESTLKFIFPAIIAIAYNLPLKSNKNSAFRLRQIKGLKIFLIAFSWTLVTVYIPINLYIVNKISLTIVLINNFLFIAILSLLFDIKDFKKDKENNLKILNRWTKKEITKDSIRIKGK